MKIRPKPVSPKQLDKEIDRRVNERLANLDVRGDVRAEIEALEKKSRQQAILNSLSPSMKIKLLKHVIERRQHGKR